MALCCMCGHKFNKDEEEKGPKLSKPAEEFVKKFLKLMDLEPVNKTFGTCRQCTLDVESVQAILHRIKQERETFVQNFKDSASTMGNDKIEDVMDVNCYVPNHDLKPCNNDSDKIKDTNAIFSREKRNRKPPKRYSHEELETKKAKIQCIGKNNDTTTLETLPKMAFVKGVGNAQILGELTEICDKTHRFRLRFICRKCKNIFGRENDFCQHILEHAAATEEIDKLRKSIEKLQYLCAICSKTFEDNFAVRRHYKNAHSEERRFRCAMCDATFKYEFNLSYHMAKHLDVKAYQCEYCQKSFVLNSELKIHLRTHTGERPYKCSICDKTFGHQSNLTAHRRIHEEKVSLSKVRNAVVKRLECSLKEEGGKNDRNEDQSQKTANHENTDERSVSLCPPRTITLNQYCKNESWNLDSQQELQIIPTKNPTGRSRDPENQSSHFSISSTDLNPKKIDRTVLPNTKGKLPVKASTPIIPSDKIDFEPTITRFRQKPKISYALRTTPLKYKISPYSLLKKNAVQSNARVNEIKEVATTDHTLRIDMQKEGIDKKTPAKNLNRSNDIQNEDSLAKAIPPDSPKNVVIQKVGVGQTAKNSPKNNFKKSEDILDQTTSVPYSSSHSSPSLSQLKGNIAKLDIVRTTKNNHNKNPPPLKADLQKRGVGKVENNSLPNNVNKTEDSSAKVISPNETSATPSPSSQSNENINKLEIVRTTKNDITNTTAQSSTKALIRNVVVLPALNMHDIVTQPPPNLVKIPAEYKFQCTTCWKYFKQKSALTKHQRTHTGEKPYKCNLCPKQFTDPSNFKRHRALHTKAAEELNISRPKPPVSPALSTAASDPDPDGIEAMQTIERFEINDDDDDDDFDDYDEDDMESYLWYDVLQHSLRNEEIRDNIRQNLMAISNSIKPAVMSNVFLNDNPD
ncbi:RE1-silencing transcription factor-like [Musca domestica]|uniref:RE1-silencing transcription factor-like n=1 Tax=Musca domestica TaxID=7370 RepID=A0ABM3V501_MUSDO|nr:RE1-silencing transcription factor-like [Musca domestica]XP_058980860.1 RE1-silencing transcription factor-like [Musca domestica]